MNSEMRDLTAQCLLPLAWLMRYGYGCVYAFLPFTIMQKAAALRREYEAAERRRREESERQQREAREESERQQREALAQKKREEDARRKREDEERRQREKAEQEKLEIDKAIALQQQEASRLNSVCCLFCQSIFRLRMCRS